MAKQILTISDFSGGIAFDDKAGPKNSFASSFGWDFRRHPTVLTSLPTTRNVFTTNAAHQVTEAVQFPSGKRWFFSVTGDIFQEDTSGVWTTMFSNTASAAVDSPFGAGAQYVRTQDTVYYSSLTRLLAINYADGQLQQTPAFPGSTNPAQGTPIGPVQDQSANSTAASTASIDTSVSELTTSRILFTPAAEPLYSIKVWVTTQGSSDLNIDVHDALNNLVCTGTLAHASVTAGAFNEVVMTTPGRLAVKPGAQNYHFHLYGSSTTTVVQTTTLNTLSTVNMQTWANRLVGPKNSMHPMAQFLQYLVIGNERYLAAWEPISLTNPSLTEFQQHRLVFPQGYETCGLATFNQYIAIAAEKKSPSGDFQDGKIFLWDGVSATYNSFLDVPDGSPYSLYSYRNSLYWFASGTWFTYSGSTINKVRRMPGVTPNFDSIARTTLVYPNMMAVRDGVLLAGFPSTTTDTNTNFGVYSYGRVDPSFPQSFNFDYQTQAGQTKTNLLNGLTTGMVKNFGDTLYVTWAAASPGGNNPTQGIDKLDTTSVPAPSSTWQSLIFDDKTPWKQKKALTLKITFKSLPAGASVTPQIWLERAASPTSGPTVSTAGSTEAKYSLDGPRFKEIQVGHAVVGGTALPVEITSVAFEFDDLKEEGQL